MGLKFALAILTLLLGEFGFINCRQIDSEIKKCSENDYNILEDKVLKVAEQLRLHNIGQREVEYKNCSISDVKLIKKTLCSMTKKCKQGLNEKSPPRPLNGFDATKCGLDYQGAGETFVVRFYKALNAPSQCRQNFLNTTRDTSEWDLIDECYRPRNHFLATQMFKNLGNDCQNQLRQSLRTDENYEVNSRVKRSTSSQSSAKQSMRTDENSEVDSGDDLSTSSESSASEPTKTDGNSEDNSGAKRRTSSESSAVSCPIKEYLKFLAKINYQVTSWLHQNNVTLHYTTMFPFKKCQLENTKIFKKLISSLSDKCYNSHYELRNLVPNKCPNAITFEMMKLTHLVTQYSVSCRFLYLNTTGSIWNLTSCNPADKIFANAVYKRLPFECMYYIRADIMAKRQTEINAEVLESGAEEN